MKQVPVEILLKVALNTINQIKLNLIKNKIKLKIKLKNYHFRYSTVDNYQIIASAVQLL
jgi:hypothetical protein